eukprot:UN16019
MENLLLFSTAFPSFTTRNGKRWKTLENMENLLLFSTVFHRFPFLHISFHLIICHPNFDHFSFIHNAEWKTTGKTWKTFYCFLPLFLHS